MYFCFHLVAVILDLSPLTKTIESFISVFHIITSDILIRISLSVFVKLGKPASFDFLSMSIEYPLLLLLYLSHENFVGFLGETPYAFCYICAYFILVENII